LDRESAFEILEKRAAELEQHQAQLEAASASRATGRAANRDEDPPERDSGGLLGSIFGETRGRSGRARQGLAETAVKSMVRQASSTIGRELMRGLLGSLRR
jgi:hypothetical protein